MVELGLSLNLWFLGGKSLLSEVHFLCLFIIIQGLFLFPTVGS